MKSMFVWFLISFYLASTSADHIRTKRDLTGIQNFMKWLLGINERSFIETVPLINNEEHRLYTIPDYQKLLVKSIPRTVIHQNMRHLHAGGLYPTQTFGPVQALRYNYPIVYNNYPPIMYDRPYGYEGYMHGRPMYHYANQVPIYKEAVPHLRPQSEANQGLCSDSRLIVKEARQPLPQPPMYIQDRMREVILHPSIPSVKLQGDIIMPPPSQRKVQVSEYSMVDDRMAKHEPTISKTPIKTETLYHPISSWTLQPKDAGAEMKNKVTFTAPVHTKYKYKMIYHNQPERNTVMEMDSIQSGPTKSTEEIVTLSVNETTDQLKNPTPIEETEDKVLADYIFIPPVSTEIPPPGESNSDDYSALASENRPMFAMYDAPFTNIGTKNKPSRVILRRRKLKSLPESARGDIPDHSSR